MPPGKPGRRQVIGGSRRGASRPGAWKTTWRQPAIASYLKRPDDTEYRAFALDVLTIDDGMISEIIAFPWAVCAGFELPPTADEHAADDSS
jgi:hypothetical protein